MPGDRARKAAKKQRLLHWYIPKTHIAADETQKLGTVIGEITEMLRYTPEERVHEPINLLTHMHANKSEHTILLMDFLVVSKVQ